MIQTAHRVRLAHRGRVHRGGQAESGYVAVMVGILLTVLLGFCAFAVDAGNWYYTGQRAQRAADAAALAGVPYLPGDGTSAYAASRLLATQNGFAPATDTTVTPKIDGKTTRLNVTVARTVKNNFGWLLGVPETTISRTAVADYAAPVPMGSPCNEFGNDPETDNRRSSNCSDTGQFWANVGSPKAPKGNGDAYQNDMGNNSDFAVNGYYYSVTLKQPVTDLTIEAFDPALINVGDTCGSNLSGAAALAPLTNTVVSDPDKRYVSGSASKFCTGDNRFGGSGDVQTQFSVLEADSSTNAWDPTSYVPRANCTKLFPGFSGNLAGALNKKSVDYVPSVAANFRQWVQLCRIGGVTPPGTYLIQVKTNDVGNNDASGHNRFSLRAYGSNNNSADDISIAGVDKMGMYGNTPAGTSTFFLARVPGNARGQLFTIRLFDIGDGASSDSTIKVAPPAEYGSTFSGCVGAGVQTGALSNCTINVSSAYNGKWQEITIPIPLNYSCSDNSSTGCWLKLNFFYGTGSNPADTTSWTASIAGDPVRLVQ